MHRGMQVQSNTHEIGDRMHGHNNAFLPTAQYLLSIGLCPVLLQGKKPVFTTYTSYLPGPAGSDELQLPVGQRPLRYSHALLQTWADEYPCANVGMLTSQRPCIDLDAPAIWEAIADLVPVTPHVKRGKKGKTFVYSVHPTDPVRRTRTFVNRFNKSEMLLEVLAHGRQTVLPPSIHPETGLPYEWVGMPEWGYMVGVPLGPEAPPPLSQAQVDAIEARLEELGLTRKRAERGEGLCRAISDHERVRYVAYLAPKLAEKLAAVREAVAGSRQDALNGACYALAGWVREGFVGEVELEEWMREACEANGYIRDDGDKAFTRQFRKALDDGWGAELPDLDGAGRVEAAMGKAPLSATSPAVGYAEPVEFWTYDGTLPPEEPELIRRLLPATPGSLAFLAGKSGMGKSFCAAAMAVALGMGVGASFFGHPVRERVGTIIVAAEGAGGMRARLYAAATAMGAKDRLPIVVVPRCGNLCLEADRAAMHGALLRARDHLHQAYGVRVGALVVDTMLAAFGMEDEGASAEAQKICGYLRQMGELVGAVVMPIHHVGKDGTQGMRGSSAFYAAADYVLICGGDHDHETGKTENRYLAVDKSRNDSTGPVANVILEVINLGLNQYGEVRTTCFYKMGEGEVDPKAHKRDQSHGLHKATFDKAYDMVAERDQLKPGQGVPTASLRMQFNILSHVGSPAGKRQAWKRVSEHNLLAKSYSVVNDVWRRETSSVTNYEMSQNVTNCHA